MKIKPIHDIKHLIGLGISIIKERSATRILEATKRRIDAQREALESHKAFIEQSGSVLSSGRTASTAKTDGFNGITIDLKPTNRSKI